MPSQKKNIENQNNLLIIRILILTIIPLNLHLCDGKLWKFKNRCGNNLQQSNLPEEKCRNTSNKQEDYSLFNTYTLLIPDKNVYKYPK